MTTTHSNTHPRRIHRAQDALANAHAPVHQSWLPRLVLGAIAIVPAISLVMALNAQGSEQAALGFFNILWTGLLMLVFGGWMVASKRFASGQKLAWVFVWLLAAPITLPLYWYRHVWGASKAQLIHD